jgi:hypothetical protein
MGLGCASTNRTQNSAVQIWHLSSCLHHACCRPLGDISKPLASLVAYVPRLLLLRAQKDDDAAAVSVGHCLVQPVTRDDGRCARRRNNYVNDFLDATDTHIIVLFFSPFRIPLHAAGVRYAVSLWFLCSRWRRNGTALNTQLD